MDPDSKRLRVSVTDGTGRAVRDGGLARWLAAIAPARAAGEVSVALVSDARMRVLNRTYRQKDKTTDVLSFSQRSATSAFAEASADRRSLGGGWSRLARAAGAPAAEVGLGDVVIATGVARRQARDAGHSYQAELRALALHGLLHLLGYDHHDQRDNGLMARVEATLRRKGGLATGLIERASSRPRARRAGA